MDDLTMRTVLTLACITIGAGTLLLGSMWHHRVLMRSQEHPQWRSALLRNGIAILVSGGGGVLIGLGMKLIYDAAIRPRGILPELGL